MPVSPPKQAGDTLARHTIVNRIGFDTSCRVLKKAVQQGRSE
jgi:hypothetical protein